MKKYLHRIKIAHFLLSISIVFTFSLCAQNLDSGLVAHWTFEEIENGNIVKDVTGNGLDGIAKILCYKNKYIFRIDFIL